MQMTAAVAKADLSAGRKERVNILAISQLSALKIPKEVFRGYLTDIEHFHQKHFSLKGEEFEGFNRLLKVGLEELCAPNTNQLALFDPIVSLAAFFAAARFISCIQFVQKNEHGEAYAPGPLGQKREASLFGNESYRGRCLANFKSRAIENVTSWASAQFVDEYEDDLRKTRVPRDICYVFAQYTNPQYKLFRNLP